MTDDLKHFRQNPEGFYDYLATRLLELSEASTSIGFNAIKLLWDKGLPTVPQFSDDLVAAAYDFRSFIQAVKPDYEFGLHHERLILELVLTALMPRGRFYAGMPPRHGKSELASVLLPAWYIGRYPQNRILHVGNAAMLIETFSRRIREIVASEKYQQIFPKFGVDPKRNRVNDWRTTSGGGYLGCGVEANISGHGADLIIIDDPHKDEDWLSMRRLDRVYHWFSQAAYTRLEPGGSIVMVATRWHRQDLPGRLLTDGVDKWRALVFPALAGDDDELGRAPGEALWPARFPATDLAKIRDKGGREWQTLYQNEPQAGTDVVFDIDKIPILGAEIEGLFWTGDFAVTSRTSADYSVACCWQWDGNELTLVDSFRMRANYPIVRDELLARLRETELNLVLPQDLIEQVLVEDIQGQLGRRRIHQISMVGDKIAKAQAAAMLVEQGKVAMVAKGAYLPFRRELAYFPQGRYDDCVDNLSLAVEYVLGLRRGGTESGLNV